MIKNKVVKTAKIETLDNPGWDITLELDSLLTEAVLEKTIVDDSDWFVKHIQNHTVSFSGDATKLIYCLSECLSFLNLPDDYLKNNEQLLNFLQNWYISQCDGYWEHLYGIFIMIDHSGFFEYKIDLDDTRENLVSRYFETIGSEESFLCQKEGSQFIGRGKINYIYQCLTQFQEWVED